MGFASKLALTPAQERLPTVADLAGYELGSRTVEYSERDAILYALAVGTSAAQVEFVYERDLRVLPTFVLPLGLWAVEAAGAIGAYDPMRSLHVGQALRLSASLPSACRLESEARISAVWDKGSAALLEIEVATERFDAAYTIIVPGAGGFGGDRGELSRLARPSREPDLRVEAPTAPNQGALYRLTGDSHPLHIDPEFAASAGFDRPVLHGLCTLGIAARAIAEGIGESPSDLSELRARFAAPVYPGDQLTFDVWRVSRGVAFEVAVAGQPVINAGEASFTPGAA